MWMHYVDGFKGANVKMLSLFTLLMYYLPKAHKIRHFCAALQFIVTKIKN